MFLLAKRTPAIWKQLSPAERALIDLNMEALMCSSAFTTKDTVAGYLGMNGDTNLNRDWNPNYQNGMVGMIIVTSLYWGFDQFEAKLAAYDDAAFLIKLRMNDMKNLLSTYANPARPSGAVIQAGLRQIVNGAIYRIPRHHRAEPCRAFQLHCQPDFLRHSQLRTERRFGYRGIRKNCEELQSAPQCRPQGNDARVRRRGCRRPTQFGDVQLGRLVSTELLSGRNADFRMADGVYSPAKRDAGRHDKSIRDGVA